MSAKKTKNSKKCNKKPDDSVKIDILSRLIIKDKTLDRIVLDKRD